jgi:hypothetical protein
LEGAASPNDQKILDDLIKNYSKNNIPDNNDINNYCLENSKNDYNFLTELNNINTQINDFVFTSPKEEGEKYHLVEKTIIDKYKEENINYQKSVEKYTELIKNLKEDLFKSTGENNFVKQAAEYQNMLKSDNAKQLAHMEQMLEECKEWNKELKEELIQKTIQKDSLFNALFMYISKYDKEMAVEMENLVKMYNNQYFKMINLGKDEKYVDDLFNQIKVYERKLNSKSKEIKELERYLIIPTKKNNFKKNPKDIKNTSDFSSKSKKKTEEVPRAKSSKKRIVVDAKKKEESKNSEK